MERNIYTITVTVYDKENCFHRVTEILHKYGESIRLRVGHPFPNRNIAVIFLITEMTNDEHGGLSGKLGQLAGVKVKTSIIKEKK